MKYASIDIETTGLNPETCEVIEIGIVLEDTSKQMPVECLPTFHCYIDAKTFAGEPYALSMHPKIFERIARKGGGFNYYTRESVASYIYNFLDGNIDTGMERFDKYRINVAGKNYATFDAKFLSKLPSFDNLIKISRRIIDPAMLYWNPATDEHLPDTKTCYERAGMPGEIAHTAVDDAIGVVKLIRAYLARGGNF